MCTPLVSDVLFLVFYISGNGVRMNFKNDQSFAPWTDCNFTYVHSSIEAWGGVTSRTVPGSIPGGVIGFFSDIFLPTVPWPWVRLSP